MQYRYKYSKTFNNIIFFKKRTRSEKPRLRFDFSTVPPLDFKKSKPEVLNSQTLSKRNKFSQGEMFKILKTLEGFPRLSLKPEAFEIISPMVSIRKKHYNPKYKWERGQKVLPVKLPDYNEKMTKEKMRTRLKEAGIMPHRYWKERPLTITTTNDIVDPYKPPEADGKASILSKDGFRSVFSNLSEKKDNVLAIRKIKKYDENFSAKTFAQEAHDLYVKAHTVLMNKDPEELSDYVTERLIMEMTEGLRLQTLRWKFIESLEPPVVVHARITSVITETNLFAQVTVRFHTKQTLAIYDRFGRLFHGSEIVPKDVLEYVVFEKHIVNEYGTWRVHAKIIPDWVPAPQPPSRTYRVEEPITEDDSDLYDFVEEQHEPMTHTSENQNEEIKTSSA